jgi:MFS family permease
LGRGVAAVGRSQRHADDEFRTGAGRPHVEGSAQLSGKRPDDPHAEAFACRRIEFRRQAGALVVAAVPGYLVAAAMMDRMGRRSIQVTGFAMMALTFAWMAVIPDVTRLVLPFLVVYGISYFFTEFGPNSTTFVYPAELFPVTARTTGHGIAAAAGKLGGFLGGFLFPVLMAWHGLLAAESAAAVVSVLGIVVTLALLPETKGLSLEELSVDRPSSAMRAAAG